MERRALLNIVVIVVCAFRPSVTSSDTVPAGHMQPLGSHMLPIEIESRNDVPDPVEFFDKYAKPGIPVILRGAAKILPNFDTWRDDEYLKKKFGKWEVLFEVGKIENSSNTDRKFVTGSFETFLDLYKRKEIYMLQTISSDHPVLDDIAMLKCLACGGFKGNVTTVPIFFSSGGTSTALHRDEYNNLSCMFDGSKEWVMFDRKTFPYEYFDAVLPGYVGLDALNVDMFKYPLLQTLPGYHATVKTGDCLFIPTKWPHHVLSNKQRNMGVSLWWMHMHELDLNDCPNDMEELPDYRMLESFQATDLDEARSVVLAMFMDGEESLTKSEFIKLNMRNQVQEEEAEEFFDLLDIDADGILTISEALSGTDGDEHGEYENLDGEKRGEL